MNGLQEVRWEKFDASNPFEQTDIHVFKISISACTGKWAILYDSVLLQEELDKKTKFKKRSDHDRYLATRYALRKILSDFVSIPPSELRFYVTENNKPRTEGIHFNVSHSGDYILIAIAAFPIGIDIEELNRDFETDFVVAECFSREEQAFFLEGGNNQIDFYTVWTRKEAILKATGEGLTDELSKLNSLADQIKRDDGLYIAEHRILDQKYVWSICIPYHPAPPRFRYWAYTH